MYSGLLEACSAFGAAFFTQEMLIALVIGVIGGMVIGALPGFSAPMGIALMIPLTYSMSAIPALTMLMAIYTSAILGGSFSAILLHIPGTPSSAATLIDGHQMTERGEALRALGTSVFSSTIGGILSCVALLFLSEPLSELCLTFNASEYFLLGIFGLTIIASLSTGNVAKGFAAGMLGLLLSTIGLDSLTQIPRLTFGSFYLDDGFNSTAALIGLFSVMQVMNQYSKLRLERNEPIRKIEIPKLKGSILLSMKDIRLILPTTIRSGIIGILVGILPGAGGAVGSFIGYDYGKRFAKDKENYGKGSIEGVAAPEAANNAVTGGAIIPLLTLGIPGSGAAAVLLGGLLIQGLIPGRSMFTTDAVTTYSIMLGFLAATIIMCPIAMILARFMGNVVRVPARVMTPCIAVFAVVGTFSIKNTMFDVYVMLAFGLLGYFMSKYHYQNTALVLGLLLGFKTELSFRQSIILSRGDMLGYYFNRPASLVLMVLIVLALLLPIFNSYRDRKNCQKIK